MAAIDENSSSSDVKVLEPKEDTASSLLASQLSPELLEEWTKRKPQYGRSHFLRYLLSTEKLGDVTFLLKKEGSEVVDKVVGHKCILKPRSEFFDVLFSGRWQDEEVDLTTIDVNSTDFRSFLEYMYVGQISVTHGNVMALYYLSRMYQVKDLAVTCETFLEENVNKDNAVTLFNVLFLHDDGKKDPSTALLSIVEFIATNIEEIIEDPEMLKLKQAQLAFIFTRCKRSRYYAYAISTSTSENRYPKMKLLRFCISWTVRHFGRKKLMDFKGMDDYIRDELRLFDLPRLRDLLTLEENYNNAGIPSEVVHPDTVYELVRLTEVRLEKKWVFRRNRADRISFRSTEPIILTGLGLYGDLIERGMPYGKRFRTEEERKPSKYDVNVRIHIHGQEHKSIYFEMHSGGSDANPFTGIYRLKLNPLYLQADEWYTISVTIAGPGSYFGHAEPGTAEKLKRYGNTPIVFQFQDASCKDEAAKLANGTGITIGQIPSLYFKLAAKNEEDEVEVLDN